MDITENIENIIEEPIHGRKFYTDDNIITLKRKLIEIYERINLEKLEEKDIIKYIGDFVKNNVKYKKSYFDSFTGKVEKFDYSDVKYRTAYGALVKEKQCVLDMPKLLEFYLVCIILKVLQFYQNFH